MKPTRRDIHHLWSDDIHTHIHTYSISTYGLGPSGRAEWKYRMRQIKPEGEKAKTKQRQRQSHSLGEQEICKMHQNTVLSWESRCKCIHRCCRIFQPRGQFKDDQECLYLISSERDFSRWSTTYQVSQKKSLSEFPLPVGCSLWQDYRGESSR